MEEKIKIGTKVSYRGGWGRNFPTEAVVNSIEFCPNGGKYGTHIEEIPFEKKDDCVFDLSDHHWCYGYQIDSIVKE